MISIEYEEQQQQQQQQIEVNKQSETGKFEWNDIEWINFRFQSTFWTNKNVQLTKVFTTITNEWMDGNKSVQSLAMSNIDHHWVISVTNETEKVVPKLINVMVINDNINK